MDVSMFVSLAKLAQRVIAVERLVAELRRIINDLGEQQFDNALAALDDALISSDPRHELTNAINHLQDAASLSQQAYRKTDYSRLQKLRGHAVPRYNPRYEAGRRICSALAIITTIYASMGERKLALKYAEELRNEVGKAYPSSFYLSRQSEWVPSYMRARFARNPQPSASPSYVGDELDEVFSFFDSVNLLLTQVGALPYNPQLQVHVHESHGFPPNVREGEKAPPSRNWNFRVSSKKDFLAQLQRARQAELGN
jgi:hypothetical protein